MLLPKIYLVVFLFFFAPLFCPCLAQKTIVKTYFGFQQMDLKWSISGNAQGTNPNVLSELIWKNLKGPMLGFQLNHELNPSLAAKLDFNLATITDGLVTDADYAADHRQEIFYNQLFKSDRGTDLSLKVSLAYQFAPIKNLKISPFLGFDVRKQQVFIFDMEPLANNPYLNSSYKNSWQGAMAGIHTCLNSKRLSVNLSVSGSFLRYKAKAKWNLIPQFAQPLSFKHLTNALALHANTETNYALTKNFGALIRLGYAYAKGFKGTDEAYYVAQPALKTQLNEVKTSSCNIGLGFNYQF